MDPRILAHTAFRRPQWRMDRVLELIRPPSSHFRRGDDHEVRTYRRFLLRMALAGSYVAAQDENYLAQPDVASAHWLHYTQDVEHRQILQARLLTDEPFEKIAARFATSAKAIEYFEKIFFNVRDRLANRDWIRKVFRGEFEPHLPTYLAERGRVLRQFGYTGGPHVLDAVIAGFEAAPPPQSEKQVDEWLQGILGQLVMSRAVAAASVTPIDGHNVMHWVKAAQKQKSFEEANQKSDGAAKNEQLVAKLAAKLHFERAGDPIPKGDEYLRRFADAAVEPRAAESFALAHGVMPEALQRDIARHEAGRSGPAAATEPSP